MKLFYKQKEVKSVAVVYKGATSDGLSHTVRCKDGSKIVVHDSNLQLLKQPDFTNIPKTPLDYRNEVGTGLSLQEAQTLARPTVLSPVQQEFMSWHHRLYHLPFRHMFRLATLGILPKRLLECRAKPPMCVACQFGQAHRRPWRVKGKKSGSIRKPEQKLPGDGVSVDQIVSAQPGLIPQMSGFLTSKRIWGCTTFVDHVSDYVYVHLMKDLTLDETLLAKEALEKLMAQAGRTIKHYHADNGRFADNGFIDAVNENNQRITFCGVGAHHQNGIIENKNKMLTLGARTLLLHGMRMWPQMIDSMFWPFAMKAVAARHNKMQVDILGRTPESILHGVEIEDIPVKSYHTLFCPVYVLDARLQSSGGAGPPKWEPRSRIGVYLGHSPFHAGNVALVWNSTTGRVSPQYHVVFDDDFTTVPYMEAGTLPPNWEDLVHHSCETATAEEVELADSWLSAVAKEGANDDQLSDPFAVVTDPTKRRKTIAQGGSKDIPAEAGPPISDSEGDKTTSRSSSQPSMQTHKVATRQGVFARSQSSNNKRAGALRDFFGSDPTGTPRSHDSGVVAMQMPARLNPHENGLRRSPRPPNVPPTTQVS